MFSHESQHDQHDVKQAEKPDFEAGFNRSNDIIVNIAKPINNTSIMVLISTMDDWIDKFYSNNSQNSGCKMICIFDSYGDDFSCVTLFYNYMKSALEKHPKVSFVGVLQYAEGNVALMYMLMRQRVVKPDEVAQSQMGAVKMGQSALKFNVIPTEFKNDVAKYLFENKIKKELLSLCFPPDDKSCITYCGEVVMIDGFGTVQE